MLRWALQWVRLETVDCSAQSRYLSCRHQVGMKRRCQTFGFAGSIGESTRLRPLGPETFQVELEVFLRRRGLLPDVEVE